MSSCSFRFCANGLRAFLFLSLLLPAVCVAAELAVFANGKNAGVRGGWLMGTSLATNAAGGFQGEPYLSIVAETAGDKVGCLAFPTADLTPFSFVSLAYRGATNGESINMTIGGEGGQTENTLLTPAADWRVISVPFKERISGGHWFDVKQAKGINFYLRCPIPSRLDLAHIVFSSEPWRPANYTFPPEVRLTGPAVAAYGAPATFDITAEVQDTGHGIAKVEFFTDNGLTLLGAAVKPPYAFAWRDVPAGTHVVSARAFDALGNWSHSAPLAITVTNAPLPAVAGDLPVRMYRRACASGFVFAMVASNSAALKVDTTVRDVTFNGTPAECILLASNGVLRAIVPGGLPDGVVTVRVHGTGGAHAELPMRLYSIAAEFLEKPVLLTNLTRYGARGAAWHGFNTNGVEGPVYWGGGNGQWNDIFRTNACGNGHWPPGVWAVNTVAAPTGKTWFALPGNPVAWDFITMKATYDFQVSADSTSGWDGTWRTIAPGIKSRVPLYLHGPIEMEGARWLRLRFTEHAYGQANGPPSLTFAGVYGEISRGTLPMINGLVIWGDSNTANDFGQTLKSYFPRYHALRSGDDPVVLPMGRASDSVASLTRIGYDSFSHHINDTDHFRAMRFVGIDIGINDRETATPVAVFRDALRTGVRIARKNGKVPILAWVPYAPSWGHAEWHQIALCDAADEVAFDYQLPPGPDQWAVIYSNPAQYVSDGVHHTAAGQLAHVAAWAETHARLLNLMDKGTPQGSRQRAVP